MDIERTDGDLYWEASLWVEKGWTQGGFAKTDKGEEVHSLHPEATSWCAWGALTKAADDSYEGARLATAVTLHFINEGWDTDLPEWNDAPHTTQEEVVAELRTMAQRCWLTEAGL